METINFNYVNIWKWKFSNENSYVETPMMDIIVLSFFWHPPCLIFMQFIYQFAQSAFTMARILSHASQITMWFKRTSPLHSFLASSTHMAGNSSFSTSQHTALFNHRESWLNPVFQIWVWSWLDGWYHRLSIFISSWVPIAMRAHLVRPTFFLSALMTLVVFNTLQLLGDLIIGL